MPSPLAIKHNMEAIRKRLDALPNFLAPLDVAASRYLKYPSIIRKDGMMAIGHRPWVAELNYMLMLYPGIEPDALNRYCGRFEIQVPEVYAEVLRAVNGGFFFGMSLAVFRFQGWATRPSLIEGLCSAMTWPWPLLDGSINTAFHRASFILGIAIFRFGRMSGTSLKVRIESFACTTIIKSSASGQAFLSS